MTNELEKKFFDTFGIEPKNISTGECKYKITPEFCEINCLDCKNTIKEATYPQISDRILLELICINEDEQPNIEWLKQCILENLIHRFEKNLFCNNEQAVKQVHTLFKETK